MLSHKILAQEFSEINSRTILMIGTMEIQLQRIALQFLAFTRSQISRLLHLCKHDISSILTTFRVSYWIKQRRILAQANKRCRLKNRQILRLLIKICLSCCFYTNSSMQEVEIVKIQSYNLLFSEISLKLYCYHPLYRFLEQAFGC